MDTKALFRYSIDQASHILKLVSANDYDRPTPCSEWSLRQLCGHIIYETAWVADLLSSKTVAEVGDKYEGDMVGDNLIQNWTKYSNSANAAVDKVKLDAITHLSYADVPAEHYIKEIAADILVHTWDVGQAMQCSVMFDEKIATEIYNFVLPRLNDFAASGLFGKPAKLSDDSPIEERLLAIYGRKIQN